MYLTEDLVKRLSEDEVKEILISMIVQNDELDNEDFFGTEGWRHYYGLEEVALNGDMDVEEVEEFEDEYQYDE